MSCTGGVESYVHRDFKNHDIDCKVTNNIAVIVNSCDYVRKKS